MISPANEDAFWLGIVGLVVLLTWSYDLYRVLRALWQDYDPLYRFTNGRALLRSSAIVVGLVRIVLGSFVRAYPNIHWLRVGQDAMAPILTLILLTGGLVLIVLWKLEDRTSKL